ncbi:MAG TPA: type II secretion system protein [Acidimicrobiales bacterium]|nr:type II secretion system protein [Acidimicrobiales bacterium]
MLRHIARPSDPPPGPNGRSERGETLVEVLVMIILMGIGFTAIFGGLMTVSRINDANAKRTKASQAVQAWAEGLQQPATKLTGASATDPYRYLECGGPVPPTVANYGSLGQTSGMMPSSWMNASGNDKPVRIEYLTDYDSSGQPIWSNTCPSKDKGLQRFTLKIETPPGVTPRVVDTLVILKRNQRCPPLANPADDTQIYYDNADLGPC